MHPVSPFAFSLYFPRLKLSGRTQALKPFWERMLLAVAACSVLREKPIGGIYI